MKFLQIIFLIPIFAYAAISQIATVLAINANVRGTPAPTGKVVETLPQDSRVEIIKQNGEWYLVQTHDYAGWMFGLMDMAR